MIGNAETNRAALSRPSSELNANGLSMLELGMGGAVILPQDASIASR